MEQKKLTMTVGEMAEALGISKPIAYSLANSAGFPTIRVGRKILISASGLEKWVKEHEGASVLS